MSHVKISASTIEAGEELIVCVSDQTADTYGQMQTDVKTAGRLNREFALSTGAAPTKISGQEFEVVVNTSSLQPGFYELVRVVFHTPAQPQLAPTLELQSGRDYHRILLEVVEKGGVKHTADEVLAAVSLAEKAIDERFSSAIDVRHSEREVAEHYAVFVFVRGILVGTRIRFDHCEIIPTGTGLDSHDALNFVNRSMQDFGFNLTFPYGEPQANASRTENPVFLIHFPHIVSETSEQAREHCVAKAELLLLAMALSRDATGTVFEIVVLDRQLGRATKYSTATGYVGNLLTGSISGENPQQLESYLSGLEKESFNRFLVGLFKQARAERQPDFQYVRLWQILEIMADSRNYDPRAHLLDHQGNSILENGEPRAVRNALGAVYCLVRDEGIGDSESTWQNVNVWLAFRNATAHFGAIFKFEQLRDKHNRTWAAFAIDELKKNQGHDRYLWALKEDVKLILMRRLVQTASSE